MLRRTKIVATLGPKSNDKVTIEKLIKSGVNVFRLNFSHGNPEDHQKTASLIRTISSELEIPTAILCDMQGPKIRIGEFKDDAPILLVANQRFRLDSELGEKDGHQYGVYMEKIYLDDLQEGDQLILDDGRISLKIENKQANAVDCIIVNGGVLSGSKGVNKFGGGLSADALTPKDRRDIRVAAGLGTDYLAISFVHSKKDIEETRGLLATAGSAAHIIAKIERAEAIKEDNLSGIIESADGLMVARGDLGVEIGDANLMAVQKQLIDAANNANRVVITATQMMESMITAPVPTRAEVFDVANAVLDGTDAVMLSAETAVGKYPIETVQAMARVIEGAEKYPLAQRSKHRINETFSRIDESVALATMYVANHLEDVSAIICMTKTGFTPLIMSRINSSMPIYAMAQKEGTSEITALYKGVFPIPFETDTLPTQEIKIKAIEILRKRGAVHKGDIVLITRGDIVDLGGSTNGLQVLRIED
ncbi:MAG: pyruvate kinase [Cellvibrionales bacterium TMED49]|nr:MAG: pyruvate kinase [Cellvibrionales bacterium TMED49]